MSDTPGSIPIYKDPNSNLAYYLSVVENGAGFQVRAFAHNGKDMVSKAMGDTFPLVQLINEETAKALQKSAPTAVVSYSGVAGSHIEDSLKNIFPEYKTQLPPIEVTPSKRITRDYFAAVVAGLAPQISAVVETKIKAAALAGASKLNKEASPSGSGNPAIPGRDPKPPKGPSSGSGRY